METGSNHKVDIQIVENNKNTVNNNKTRNNKYNIKKQ